MLEAKFKKIKEKVHLSKEAQGIIWEIVLFVLGFALMSVRFLFGTYPFAIALLGGSKRQAPFVFAGAMLSVLFLMDGETAYVVALIALLGLRIAASFIKRADFTRAELGERKGKKIADALFCEGIELRVAVATLVALGIGVYKVIANGYVYYDVFVLVFYTVLVGILTFCLSGIFEERDKRVFVVGLGSLVFCVAYALSGKEIGGIDLVIFFSCAAVLYVSKNMGGIKGAALGVILGIAQGGALSGTLGIFGLVAGFLWSISPYLAIMCSFVLGMGYAISAMGYEAIVYMTPELLAASLIMYPVLRFEVLPHPAPLQKKEKGGMRAYHLESKSQEIRGKLNELSLAYGDVAKMLKGVGEKTKTPDKRGYLDMSLEVCESYCYACPKHSICWERDVDTTDKNINKMGQALFIKREVVKGDVDEKFLHRCPNIEKIMDELNSKNKSILARSVKSDKLETCAQDYESTAKIIDGIFKAEEQLALDKALTERAVRVCAACGLLCDKVEVIGAANKRIVATGVDVQRSKCTAMTLRREMEKGLGIALKEAEVTDTDGYVTLKMESESNFRVEAHCQSHTLEDGEENGDSYLCFESGAHQYMVICDGMGSGREAHLTSQLCVDVLSKMLSVSRDKATVLAMLNNLIRAKNTECSSTVDLFEFNLISGDGRFVKSGACPSFIKRGDKVFKLQSKTAPIGIMKGLDAEELSFVLNKGDICVMVSDGVVPSRQDSRWLMQFLSELKEDSPRALCQSIMKEAKKRGVKDDMTVICAVIN